MPRHAMLLPRTIQYDTMSYLLDVGHDAERQRRRDLVSLKAAEVERERPQARYPHHVEHGAALELVQFVPKVAHLTEGEGAERHLD